VVHYLELGWQAEMMRVDDPYQVPLAKNVWVGQPWFQQLRRRGAHRFLSPNERVGAHASRHRARCCFSGI
jgi:hypothetical protein